MRQGEPVGMVAVGIIRQVERAVMVVITAIVGMGTVTEITTEQEMAAVAETARGGIAVVKEGKTQLNL
ncbi:hypothetical protein KU73_04015 [Pectobacterium wasabiae]|uniref:Uncharacterized protein n=1 Tax=Pectobacterium wasabiae TaxID=55208 RepID=A0AAW3EKN3_9GAMM|nr:hypothetical protein A7983_19145 [Pectobacterium wasabiae CFBP 3304]KFX09399.1 hypothetical protein JV38_00285 [Pectobacterium wasabiae]KGA29601.1 hypothetical protein KU73_04015 [Pectobacterium wasabiae]